MSRRSVEVTVRHVYVDVPLEDIDTDDLTAELDDRRKDGRITAADVSAVPSLGGEEVHPLHEIYYAIKFGLSDRAAELTRAYVCDQLGVVL